MCFSLLLSTKEDILKKMVTKPFMGPIDFNSMGKKSMLSRIEEFIQVWNNLRVSKSKLIFIWVKYPLPVVRLKCH